MKTKKREAFSASLLNEDNIVLIIEFSKFALDSQTLGTFFDVADNLGIDVERLREVDDLLGNLRTNVNLHAGSAIIPVVEAPTTPSFSQPCAFRKAMARPKRSSGTLWCP